MRAQYADIVEKQQLAEKKTEQEKLGHILALWQQRVEWWNREFKYPKDFRFREEKSKGEARGGAVQGAEARPGAPPAAAPAQGALVIQEPAREGAPASSAGRAPGNVAAKNGELKDATGETSVEPAIAIKPWDPQTPYLAALKKATPEQLFRVYMAQRKAHGDSPGFFLDCAELLYRQKQDGLALQVVSNVAELELENAALVRILAHKLEQIDQLELAAMLFEEALRLRPEEPQSYRDLALVLARRAGARQNAQYRRRSAEQAQRDLEEIKTLYGRAIELLNHVVMNHWDRFDEIEVIALMELNALIPRAKAAGIEKFPVEPRLIKLLDVDARIVLTWDTDLTDMDLWVTEPSGEKAFYGHNLTTIGGIVSRDFTQGYGPEEYVLKKAMHGMYKIEVNYYGTSGPTLSGATTLQVDVLTNYGRPNEKRKSITLRLTEKKETFEVGAIEF
jgi:tetratricopeptide (TPR) repeat protein